jgi:hypothetical protein
MQHTGGYQLLTTLIPKFQYFFKISIFFSAGDCRVPGYFYFDNLFSFGRENESYNFLASLSSLYVNEQFAVEAS